MTRFKDFGSPVSEEAAVEPLSFQLYGEKFDCVPQIQGKVLLDLVADSAGDDPVKQAALITEFFDNVLRPESATRFNTLLKDPDKIVTVETLAEITGWLVEEYTGRPEGQPGA